MDFNKWSMWSKKDWIEFGNKIKQYRADKRLTIKQFAENCGLSYSTIIMLEHGKKELLFTTVAKVNQFMEGR